MDMNTDYAIVQILENFLGKAKSEVDALTKEQWQFNCPSTTSECRHDVDKFNLEYNAKKKMFKCWKCDPKYSGYVYKLVKDHGSNQDLSRLKVLLPPDKIKNLRDKHAAKPRVDHNTITCKLPEGYMPLNKKKNTKLYKIAWEYLVNERKVSPFLIDKYEIGYTETGPRRFRIIIPSKNALGRFNYYEARSYLKDAEIPYIKPSSKEVAKNDIIFNEYFINWDLPIFLVEGVFDMFRLPNAIPVLGKEVSELLIDELLKHNSTVFLCFDPDAIKKTEETYTKLSSLGLNVFFVDLTSYNKDISKIFEDHGKEEVAKAVSNLKRLDLSMQVAKKLKS
jgi:hypothetical protein